MKILIVGPEIDRLEDIKDFGGVWSFYLAREFRARGVEVVFQDQRETDPAHYARLPLEEIDHVVSLGRWASKVPQEIAWIMASRIRGTLAQIADRNRPADPVDVTLTVVDDERPSAGINVHVGWAGDSELLGPRQGETLRILIDHPNYGAGPRVDYSLEIAEQTVAFVRGDLWRGRWPGATVRRMVDGGVENVNFDRLAPAVFTRKHIPFARIAAEYSQAHVFLVTHPESVGLSVLETALCGALVVAPEGYISPALLKTVRHVTYKRDIPWQQILDAIDIAESRHVAMQNSWARVAARILHYLETRRPME
ncbi:hypothetical protein [Alsobacter sp. R-9]